MSEAVREILERIQHLPATDRLELQDVLAQPVGAHPATFVRYLTLALGAPPRQEGGIDGWFEVANPHPRGGIRPAP